MRSVLRRLRGPALEPRPALVEVSAAEFAAKIEKQTRLLIVGAIELLAIEPRPPVATCSAAAITECTASS